VHSQIILSVQFRAERNGNDVDDDSGLSSDTVNKKNNSSFYDEKILHVEDQRTLTV
jgi:hypothetical protein